MIHEPMPYHDRRAVREDRRRRFAIIRAGLLAALYCLLCVAMGCVIGVIFGWWMA